MSGLDAAAALLPDAFPTRAVVSLSGGMDSTSLLLHLLAGGCQVHGLSFDYGQKHVLELERLQANLQYLRSRGYSVQHEVVPLQAVGRLFHSALLDEQWQIPEGHYEEQCMKQTVVPNRNAIFLSICCGYALSLATRDRAPTHIALGVHGGDHAIYPDCRPEFYQAAFSAFRLGNWDSQLMDLYLPYLHADKLLILQDALRNADRLQVDFDVVFGNTCTSYAPDAAGRSSGRTGADIERILAFHRLGRRDPVAYVEPWEIVLRRALQVEQQARESK